MAVLIEGICVIVNNAVVAARYTGGIAAFQADIPSNSFCSDTELTRVGFMVPSDVQAYVRGLERKGLLYVNASGVADTVAVVDQRTGFMRPCNWASFGSTLWQDKPTQPVSVCAAVPTRVTSLAVPDWWNYSTSLSASHRFVPNGETGNLEFVRREGPVDVYRDRDTGIEYYVGRTQ